MISWIKRSFKNRIFCTVLIVTLLPLLLCALFMMHTMVSRNERIAENQASAELDAALEELESFWTELESVTQSLSDSTAIRSALKRNDASKLMYQVLYRNTEPLRGCADFALYDSEGRRLYSTDDDSFTSAADPNWGILRAAGLSGHIVFSSAEERGLSAAEAIRSYDGSVIGYVCLYVGQKGFDALISPLFAPANDLFILDSTWRGIYFTQASRAESLAETLREQLLIDGELRGGEEECSFTVRRSERLGISLILQQPKTYTTAVMKTVYSVSVMTGLICAILCFWAAWGLSRYLSEPVQRLDEAMGRVEKGDYSVKLEASSEDELGRLTASFNRMTNEYRENLERSVQRERELNETRLSMLQAQLNPHFLYNTLDCIKWMGVTNSVPQIAGMATDLAALLRAGISGDKLITLERELELINRYLEIQEIRFGDSFTCETDIDERFRSCIIPKLILQPLVENAIIHGLPDVEYGYIKLSVREEQGTLVISVADNGRGMDDKVLEAINAPEKRVPGEHLGLYNVDRIVKLYYGEGFGISAVSAPGEGCTVELRLPLTREGDTYAEDISG